MIGARSDKQNPPLTVARPTGRPSPLFPIDRKDSEGAVIGRTALGNSLTTDSRLVSPDGPR